MKNNIVISQKILKIFNKQQRLAGVVAFLDFIKKVRNLETFYYFCKKQNITLPEQALNKVLFHGSNKPKTVLTPNASIGHDGKAEQENLVYATDDPNYAIFLAILNLKNGSASVNASAKNTTLIVDLDFVNGPSKLRDGYLHIVTADNFKKTKNREHKVNQQIKALFIIPVVPADLTVPIYIQAEPQ